jgi:hypothetical protein
MRGGIEGHQDVREVVTDAEPVAPFHRSQPEGRGRRAARLNERQVTVTNPDGSKTTHTYWSA